MSEEVSKFQDLLLSLYTSKKARVIFFKNRENYTNSFNNNSLKISIKNLDQNEVEEFAQSLIRKRYGILKEITPHVLDEIPNPKETYQRFSENTPLTNKNKHSVDAIKFIRFLKKENIKSVTSKTYLTHLLFDTRKFDFGLVLLKHDLDFIKDYITNKPISRPLILIKFRLFSRKKIIKFHFK